MQVRNKTTLLLLVRFDCVCVRAAEKSRMMRVAITIATLAAQAFNLQSPSPHPRGPNPKSANGLATPAAQTQNLQSPLPPSRPQP